jgi:hypothetical protein
MKNPTAEVLEAAVQARRDGRKAKEIQAEFDLSHSQFEFAWLRLEVLKDEIGTVPATPAGIATARAEGKSWGVIAVLADTTEGKVRNLFKEATGAKSQGQRIGKGGRWLYNEQGLYEGEFNKPGTTIPADAPEFKGREGATAAQEAQRNLLTVDFKDLKAQWMKATGRKSFPKGGMTKVQMIREIIATEA